MPQIISIPYVPRDERIGSVFNELFQIIYETERSADTEIIWDFADCLFFHPFFIAPLAIYKEKSDLNIKCVNINTLLKGYFDLIHFDDLLSVEQEDDIRDELKEYYGRSYIPVCKFNMSTVNVDRVQTVLQGIIERQSKVGSSVKTPLSYMLGELVGNINEHSMSSHGYLFSQYLPSEKCINICIADAGITVYGSYVSRGKFLPMIGNSEADALRMANEGYSTKDRPDSESRGFGISTTKSMLVNGLKGAFFMLSGNAFHRYDSDEKIYINLPKELNWNGTIVLLKIPVDAPDGFNYIDYLNF